MNRKDPVPFWVQLWFPLGSPNASFPGTPRKVPAKRQRAFRREVRLPRLFWACLGVCPRSGLAGEELRESSKGHSPGRGLRSVAISPDIFPGCWSSGFPPLQPSFFGWFSPPSGFGPSIGDTCRHWRDSDPFVRSQDSWGPFSPGFEVLGTIREQCPF